jgi:hypothetical protein
MRPFLAELEYLSELYRRLRCEFTGLLGKAKAGDVTVLINTTLRNRDLLDRIDQMNARVSQLAQEWDSFRNHLDTSTRQEIVELAESVRHQGTQLSLLCTGLLGALGARRENLEKQLAEVQKGSSYLQSVKPVKNNYPKFVDSLG